MVAVAVKREEPSTFPPCVVCSQGMGKHERELSKKKVLLLEAYDDPSKILDPFKLSS